jgi:integrase
MGKTVLTLISEAAIKRYQNDLTVGRLNDSSSELQFHFSQSRLVGSWHIVTTINGQSVSKKLANWPTIKTSTARKLLPEKLALLIVNPAVDINESDFDTIGQLLTWYVDRSIKTKLSKKRKANIQSLVKNQLLTYLSDCQLIELTPNYLDENLMLPLFGLYQLSTCRNAFAVLKTAFKVSAKLKKITVNPLADVAFSDFTTAKIKPRQPNVQFEDIRVLLTTISERDDIASLFALFMLMHGTRIGETRAAQWGHINVANRIWRIPGNHTKTAEEHQLPLTDMALAVLQAIRESNQHYTGCYLFPATRANATRCWNEVEANIAIQSVSGKSWTARDLRNIARTGFEIVGGDWATGERLVNHSLGVMDKTYVGHHAVWQRKTTVLTQYQAYLANNDESGKIAGITAGYSQNNTSANTADLAA